MSLPNLTREQADRLRAQIQRQVDYLESLADRMRKLRWWDDEVWDATHAALGAMKNLRMNAMSAGCADWRKTPRFEIAKSGDIIRP